MTREEKVAKRKARAARRAEKHNDKYRSLVANARNNGYPSGVLLTTVVGRVAGWMCMPKRLI